jgi:tRNA nucleotidyltransferase (CCA-adding enzyme)
MAVRLDGDHWGELLDPFYGQADLAAGVVRALHPLSFQDDPTRLFRAVRYEQRLTARIAPETEALFAGAWASLATLTPERTRHELAMIFREARAAAMLQRLHDLGVLAHTHPALRWSADTNQRAELISTLPLAEWKLNTPFEPEAAYLALLLMTASSAEVTEALARLNPSRAVSQAVATALTLRPTWTRPSEAVAVLDSVSELAVVAAYVVQRHPDFSTYLAHWRFVRPTTAGDNLIARGLPPGPRFKDILWQLRAAWLDGNIHSAAEEQTWLERLLRP